MCPHKLFILHSSQFIAEHISLGLEVILTVDANEHVVKKLSRQLNNLGMVEAFFANFNPEGSPASYFRGRHQIEGVWYIRKIVPTAVSICTHHFDTGDHRAYVVDFQMNSMLGELSISLCVPNRRRLTCSFPIIVQRYLERDYDQFQLHNIPFKIHLLKDQ